MQQSCWQIWSDRGFLHHPNPLHTLRGLDVPLSTEITEHIETLGAELSTRLYDGSLRPTFEQLPVYDMNPLRQLDGQFHIIEYMMMRYGYFANAYVYADPQNPAQKLPSSIAIPLVQLSHMVERPPILTYASYILSNWRLKDPNGDICIDNANVIQSYCGGKDEAGFILIHMTMEAQAAPALTGIKQACESAQMGDISAVVEGLAQIPESIQAMMNTFSRMTEVCDTDVYYHEIRPYLFGLNGIIYEGVDEFGGIPQNFRGQSGAQSSIIPALVAGLGLEHEQSAMTHHLTVMRDYMPKPHRDFIAQMTRQQVRPFAMKNRQNSALRDAYNTALAYLLKFRQLHLHFASAYVAQKVANPIGTGGTNFMAWLKQLADETQAQLI